MDRKQIEEILGSVNEPNDIFSDGIAEKLSIPLSEFKEIINDYCLNLNGRRWSQESFIDYLHRREV